VKANRLKPSHPSTVATPYRMHLEPAFGDVRLDAITDENVQRFKGHLLDEEALSAKQV
jgi:hypothetical protein